MPTQEPRDGGWLPSEPPPTPTAAEVLAEEQWAEFTEMSASEVAGSATRWQEGMAALTSALAAGILIANAPDASALDPEWRAWVLLAVIVAALGGLVGLGCVLTASAGVPTTITRKQFAAKYITAEEFRRQKMRSVAWRIRVARYAVVGSILATICAAVLLWVAPGEEPMLNVQTGDGSSCGAVESADGGEIRLQVRGERNPRVIPLHDVTNLSVVGSC